MGALLIRKEKDSGLLCLIRTNSNGRIHTAVTKLIALAISIMPIVIGVYFANLAFCELRFGIGSFERSIQSVLALRGCTLQVSVLQYLLLFLLVKWVSCLIIGFIIMLCLLAAKNMLQGVILCFTIIFSQLALNVLIPATSSISLLKYANITALSQVNEFLGNYRVIKLGNSAVGLPSILLVSAIIFCTASIAVFFILFERAELVANAKPLQLFPRIAKPVTIFKAELGKLFIGCGAGIVILLVLGITIYHAAVSKSTLTQQDIIYNDYMTQLSGRYTTQTSEKLNELNKDFTRLYELDYLLENKKISEETYEQQRSANFNLIFKQNVFLQIVNTKLRYIKENPSAWMVNERPYSLLFMRNGADNIIEALIASIAGVLCFAGFLAMEFKTSMANVIKATPLGRSVTIRTKLRLMVLVQAFIAVISCIPSFYRVISDYGLHSLFAPAMSLDIYQSLPSFIPIAFVVILLPLLRVLACIAMGVIVLCFSQKVKSSLFSAFVSSAVLFLSLLIAASGINGFEWISFFPLFHGAALLGSAGKIITLSCYIFIASAIIWSGGYYLYNSWDVQYFEKRDKP